MNILSKAYNVKVVEIIEGDLTTPSGFVAEYDGVRRVCVSEEHEQLMDEAKQIGFATGRHFTQVLPLLLERRLRHQRTLQ